MKLVPAAGFEPARPLGLGILSPLCLPFHHAGTLAGSVKAWSLAWQARDWRPPERKAPALRGGARAQRRCHPAGVAGCGEGQAATVEKVLATLAIWPLAEAMAAARASGP